MALFDNEIQERANSRAQIGAPHLTEAEIAHLNNTNRRKLLDALGIDIGENWSKDIPTTRGVPRMFIMQARDDGSEMPLTFKTAKIVPGSPEFYRQIQLGNVFAFPAGKTEPVQVQIRSEKSGKYVFSFSKPVTQENVPSAPVKKPSLWMRFAGLFGGYRKERAAWKNRFNNEAELINKFSYMKEQRAGVVANEAEEAGRLLEDYDNGVALEKALKAKTHFERSMDLMTSIYHPQPVMKREKGILRTDKESGLYTEEQFKSLKVYPKTGKGGIDLDSIQVGNSGMTVTPEEFAAVTMYALWLPEPSKAAMNITGRYDPYAEECVREFPDPLDPTKKAFKPEDVETLVYGAVRSWPTGDLFIDPPRDNEGGLFKTCTNQGRELAVKAFQDYANHDNTKLAKLIADGLNMAAQDFRIIDSQIVEQNFAVMATSGKLLGLMEKDPVLKDAVMKQGLNPENLKVIEGAQTYLKLEQGARDAEYELMKAKQERRPLTQEEKLKYTKAMLLPKLANTKLAVENSKYADDEERCMLQGVLVNTGHDMKKANGQRINNQDLQEYKKHPEKAPKPKPGEIYIDTAGIVAKNLGKAYNPNPKAMLDLAEPKGLENLNKLADSVIIVEGLADKSADELFAELNHDQEKPHIKLADSIVKAAGMKPNQPQEEKKGQELQQGVTQKKANTIADRKNIFEPKQNGF